MESKNIFFRGHEKKYIEFRYKFNQGGDYQISLADRLPKEVCIEKGIRIIPRVQDKSGCGHTALMHGTPKVLERGGILRFVWSIMGIISRCCQLRICWQSRALLGWYGLRSRDWLMKMKWVIIR